MPIIVLDPGHGQYGNKHTVTEGFFEGTQNFKHANMLMELLRERGFTVYTTRESIEDNPSLEDRGRLAGERGADMFISIHSNAPSLSAPNYAEVRGVETYYSLSDPENNKKIAKRLNDAVVLAMNSIDRGIKTRAHPEIDGADFYGVLRSSAKHGCRCAFLVEHGFHTNAEDSAVLESDEGLMRIAKAECDVLCELFL